jgi:hypothetical protein
MKFQCKLTGNVFNFEHEWDIVTMKAHPEYVEFKEEEKPVEEKKVVKKSVKSEE